MLLADRSPTPLREKSLKFGRNEVVPFGKSDPVASLLPQAGNAFPPQPPLAQALQDLPPDPVPSKPFKPNARQRKAQRFKWFKQGAPWQQQSKGGGKSKGSSKNKAKSAKPPGKVKGHKK
jgi:hypothetical protein